MTNSEQFHTIAEVAGILRCSPRTAYDLVRDGKIPATKPAGTWLIPKDKFAAWLTANGNEAMTA